MNLILSKGESVEKLNRNKEKCHSIEFSMINGRNSTNSWWNLPGKVRKWTITLFFGEKLGEIDHFLRENNWKIEVETKKNVNQSIFRWKMDGIFQIVDEIFRKIEKMELPCSLGMVWMGMGCQGRSAFQIWLPFGGNMPAKWLSALINVRSTSVERT